MAQRVQSARRPSPTNRRRRATGSRRFSIARGSLIIGGNREAGEGFSTPGRGVTFWSHQKTGHGAVLGAELATRCPIGQKRFGWAVPRWFVPRLCTDPRGAVLRE